MPAGMRGGARLFDVRPDGRVQAVSAPLEVDRGQLRVLRWAWGGAVLLNALGWGAAALAFAVGAWVMAAWLGVVVLGVMPLLAVVPVLDAAGFAARRRRGGAERDDGDQAGGFRAFRQGAGELVRGDGAD